MNTNRPRGNRKKILVLTSTFPRWAGDTEPPFVFELCRRLTNEFDVLVLAPHTRGASLHEKIDRMEIIRFRYFLERWEALAYRGGILANLKRHARYYLLVPFFMIAQLHAMHRILRLEKIDAIHAHWLIPQGLVAIICKFFWGPHFPPLLCTSHGSDLLGLTGVFFDLLKQSILRRADMVTVVSNTMKKQALALKAQEEKLLIIPMGIDATTIFTPASYPKRQAGELLFVGRLVKSKAVDDLINAMPTILAQYSQAKLFIAGDGPQKSQLIDLARQLGIYDKVYFLGAVSNHDLPSLYRRAAIFISPSTSEGFGLTIVEALACECPVIASNLLAIQEIIIDGETGLTVSTGDVNELSSKVLALLADPAFCNALASAGRASVLRQFDWNIVGKNYANLLHQLTSNTQS